jgi:hypothetical protein
VNRHICSAFLPPFFFLAKLRRYSTYKSTSIKTKRK